MYFQNKARHYANLRSMKPAVKTHRDRRRSLSPVEEGRKMPYIKRYEMEKQNEGIINRIGDIMTREQTEVEKHGYTRYNQTFRPKSHLAIEQRKAMPEIVASNHLLAKRVL